MCVLWQIATCQQCLCGWLVGLVAEIKNWPVFGGGGGGGCCKSHKISHLTQMKCINWQMFYIRISSVSKSLYSETVQMTFTSTLGKEIIHLKIFSWSWSALHNIRLLKSKYIELDCLGLYLLNYVHSLGNCWVPSTPAPLFSRSGYCE